ncbi:MAG: hypothetical protein VX938_02285, partial [Myxococcota bacterium]|nr:hypothetical protein [Myxococcota bacterium]
GEADPGDDEPSEDEPGDDEPGDDEPGDEEPGDDEPGDDEPGDESPFDINASVSGQYCGSADVLSYDGDPSGGACENEQDITALLHGECVDVWQVISEQGIAAGCLGADGFIVECVAAALQDHKELTDGCAGCFGEHVSCIADSCVTDCVLDEGSDACLCCQLENGCYGADGFDGCAGLDFVVSPEIFETCGGP